MKNFIAIALVFVGLISCNDDTVEELTTGNVVLTFENSNNGNPLVLDSQTYVNGSGENYQVNELKYIISNIVFTKSDGSFYAVPPEESYFVIDEQGNKTVSLIGVPAGEYTNVRFGFGIDPTKYPIESGTLNFVPTAEEAGMLWTWSAGYKFLKFEGTYVVPSDTPQPSSPFTYHVGSHGANLDNYKEINLAFAKAVSPQVTASQVLVFDVAKIFDSAHTMSLEEKDDVQVDPVNAPKIAENVRTAFSVQ